MPVAYLNKGVRKDGLSEANERSEEQSERSASLIFIKIIL